LKTNKSERQLHRGTTGIPLITDRFDSLEQLDEFSRSFQEPPNDHRLNLSYFYSAMAGCSQISCTHGFFSWDQYQQCSSSNDKPNSNYLTNYFTCKQAGSQMICNTFTSQLSSGTTFVLNNDAIWQLLSTYTYIHLYSLTKVCTYTYNNPDCTIYTSNNNHHQAAMS
jgi:hypothetical protein